ncbi:MAG: hypothetical protein ACRC6I_03375 [Paracoccaceae bacterium]
MGAGSDALETAIEHAWRVFDLPAPATTGVCVHCCMDRAIEADFLRRKARDLPDHYIRDWYFAAYDNSMTHDHVAWFLPRVMEMLAAGKEIAMVGQEVVLSRLPFAGYPDQWSHQEVTAVNRFALAFLEAKLVEKTRSRFQDIDSWLCMIGQGGIDVAPLLRRMDAMTDDDLAALLHGEWFISGLGYLPNNAFWSVEPAKTLVRNWYTSSALAERMERAAMAGNEKALEVYDLIVTYGGIPQST